MGGAEARTRYLLREPSARRFAPVGAAVLLLLWLGVGGGQSSRSVDVLAHVFGLLAGLALGLQLAGALVACVMLAACWALALT
jgi:membrane associated rhomboid family serine protease